MAGDEPTGEGPEHGPTRTDLPDRADLLAIVAHELRRPLAPIANAAKLLELQPDPTGVDLEVAAIIQRQLRQVTRLVDDLLDVSGFARGEIDIDPRSLDLRHVVGAAIETVRSEVVDRGHALSLTVSSAPTILRADAGRLQQVVENLLHNAARYTPEGGHIRIVLEKEGDDVVLRVRDNGVGMSSKEMELAFHPSRRPTPRADRSLQGLGVGLALSRQILELHRGSIEARSPGPGGGTEVTVRLPALPGNRVEPEAPPRAPETDAPPPPLKLLIVDDHPDMTGTLQSLLQLLGHSAGVAATGRQALEHARDTPPDIVFLDIGLPDMDGFEVARRMRSEPSLRETFLVAMTGYGGSEVRARAQEAGFDRYTVKPLQIDELRELLRTHPRRGASDNAP